MLAIHAAEASQQCDWQQKQQPLRVALFLSSLTTMLQLLSSLTGRPDPRSRQSTVRTSDMSAGNNAFAGAEVRMLTQGPSELANA